MRISKILIPTALGLTIIVSFFTACKKETTTPSLQSGPWLNSLYGFEKYLFFEDQGNVKFFEKSVYGIKFKTYGHYISESRSLSYSKNPGENPELGIVSFSNDTLYIDYGNRTEFFVKATSAPDTANWVRNIQIHEKYSFGNIYMMGAIDNNGTDIYIRSFQGNKIYKLDMNSKQVTDSITTASPNISPSIAYHNGGFWTSNNTVPYRLFKYDFSTGVVVNNSIPYSYGILGLATEGDLIYSLDQSGYIRTFNPVISDYNAIISYPSFGSFLSFTIDLHKTSEGLLIISGPGIMEANLSTTQINRNWNSDEFYITGITEINGQMWAVGLPKDNNLFTYSTPYLLRITLQ